PGEAGQQEVPHLRRRRRRLGRPPPPVRPGPVPHPRRRHHHRPLPGRGDVVVLTPTALRAALTEADPELAPLIGPIKVSARRKTLGWSLKPGEPAVTLQVPAHVPVPALVHTARE